MFSILHAFEGANLAPIVLFKQYLLYCYFYGKFYSFTLTIYQQFIKEALELIELWIQTLPYFLTDYVTTKAHIQLLRHLLKTNYLDILYVIALNLLLKYIISIRFYVLIILFKMTITRT